jgi:glutamine synthetase type III
MDNRTINEHYAEIGMDLIQTEDALIDIANSQATIIYLSSEHKKVASGKKVLGQCEKVADKYKWGIPCDFTITVFEPNVEGMTEEIKEPVVVLQVMLCGEQELLAEVMWKEDFDKMYEPKAEKEDE